MSEVLKRIIAAITTVTTLLSSGLGLARQYHLLDFLGEAFGTYFEAETNDDVDAFLEKTGGIVKGVCHPNENLKQISEANIGWVRFDFPLPYDKNSVPNPDYTYTKARAEYYANAGIKVMAVTPYPYDYIEAGMDPRDTKNDAIIKEIAEFYATDLQGVVSAFQVTNEMGVEHFTLPLTLQEAARFIGIQLEAMNDVKGNIVTGYNIASLEMYNLCNYMIPWNEYCDYVGVDIYLGCFEGVFKGLYGFDLFTRFVWGMTHKPVLINEFGYIGYGETKTEEQKTEILKTYGYNNEAEARADFMNFVDKLPYKFRDHLFSLDYSSPDELADKLFDTELANHLYREIPGGYQLSNYKHNPEGQANFFTDVIARMQKHKFIVGAFVYCYCDSSACYICGQDDCPVETGWGLVDLNGNPKSAYYAVQEAFSKWN